MVQMLNIRKWRGLPFSVAEVSAIDKWPRSHNLLSALVIIRFSETRRMLVPSPRKQVWPST